MCKSKACTYKTCLRHLHNIKCNQNTTANMVSTVLETYKQTGTQTD